MAKNQVKRFSSSYVDLEGHEDSAAILAPTIGITPAPQTIKSPLLRECLAEFLGTFILLCFGDGVVAQVVLSDGANGSYTHINLCWGIAVMLGIHFSGGVSGAHLNPAVTSTLALFGRFPWSKVPFYMLAQLLGAFCGAATVFLVYYPLFNSVDPDRTTTQGVFATYPNDGVPNATAFVTEVVGTALLLSGIFAIGDQLNKPASPYTSPSAVALLVVGIGMAFGMNSGYAINPARDLGPRLFSMCAGWGTKVFTLRDCYFWIPIVGPLLGGAIGGGVYIGLIEYHHPKTI
jgi:MIP family channel proteins